MPTGIGQYTGGTGTWGSPLGSTAAEALIFDQMDKNIQSLVMLDTPILNLFKEEKKAWDLIGRRLVKILKTANNGSFQSVGEGGTLPDPGKTAQQNHETRAKYIYGLMAITGPLVAAMRGQGGAVDIVAHEQESLVENIKFNLQRMLWGNGTGILAKCASLAGSVVTLDTTYQTIAANGWPTDNRMIAPGMAIMWGLETQLCTLADGVARAQVNCDGYGVVASVDDNDSTKFTITKTAGNDPAALDCFVPGKGAITEYALTLQAGAIFTGNEFDGVRHMSNLGANTSHDNSTLQAISSASLSAWAGLYRQLNAGVVGMDLTIEHMIQAADLFNRRNKKHPDVAFWRSSVKREYFKCLSPDVRYVNTAALKGGYASLSFEAGAQPVRMIVDENCFSNEIVFMYTPAFWYGWMQKLGWITTGNNGNVMRPVNRKDEGEAIYGAYGNFGTDNRRMSLRLRDINATEV